MKLNRFGAALGVLASGALVLSACGSDNNAGGGSSTGSSAAANVNCGGKKTLKASGSTAQANAMNQWIKNYQTACSGANIEYTGNGSGAGQQAFIAGTADFAVTSFGNPEDST